MTIILSNVNRFKKNFIETFLDTFAVKRLLKSHCTLHMLLHYLVKHQCQKTSDCDRLQGSVATYLRCGRVVNNQIKKGYC